ncbi:MAG: chemotaxis protein CheW [Phycisphaerales bacterium]
MSTTETNVAGQGVAVDEAIRASLAESIDQDVTRYVIVEMNSSNYGFPTGSTIELTSSSAVAVTRVPKSPLFVRGVINHRGSIIPVVDTRALLGLATIDEQRNALIANLREHEQEAVDWLDAIHQSVRAEEALPTAVDPKTTKLGSWRKQTIEDERTLASMMRYHASMRTWLSDLEAPHKALYAAIEVVEQALEEGGKEGAVQAIVEIRETSLASMHTCFRRMIRAVKGGFKTMLIITELGDRKAAFEVDAVHTVKDCAEQDVDTLPDTATGAEFMSGLVHQPDGSYILICDLEQMYEQACPR